MSEPYVTIDTDKLEANARTVTALAAVHGVEIVGVTKGACGEPAVAAAMLRGGVTAIGDSRLGNVLRLRAAGIETRYMLLRSPPLSMVDAVVETVDVSLNSELAVIAALSAAARRRGRVHDIIVMVDLGDLREGVWPDDLAAFAAQVEGLPGVRFTGLGTNLSCFGGVLPTTENLGTLVTLAEQLEADIGRRLDVLSGGASNTLDLLAAGGVPARIDQLRVGEAILLGRESTHRAPIAGTHQDAFTLSAEVIELKRKPTVPIGPRAQDAFGEMRVFVDHGLRDRAILNVGRGDVDVDGTVPRDSRLTVLGASSDHLLVDVTEAREDVHIGDMLAFSLNYAALLSAMSSRYVEKRIVSAGDHDEPLA